MEKAGKPWQVQDNEDNESVASSDSEDLGSTSEEESASDDADEEECANASAEEAVTVAEQPLAEVQKPKKKMHFFSFQTDGDSAKPLCAGPFTFARKPIVVPPAITETELLANNEKYTAVTDGQGKVWRGIVHKTKKCFILDTAAKDKAAILKCVPRHQNMFAKTTTKESCNYNRTPSVMPNEKVQREYALDKGAQIVHSTALAVELREKKIPRPAKRNADLTHVDPQKKRKVVVPAAVDPAIFASAIETLPAVLPAEQARGFLDTIATAMFTAAKAYLDANPK